MPSAKSRGKRTSVTDKMETVQQKLQSGVDRKLIAFEDRGDMWVCVAGAKGHKSYIYNIRDRLRADRFQYTDASGWHKFKAFAPERAIGLTDKEKERCIANLARARAIRAADVDVEGSAAKREEELKTVDTEGVVPYAVMKKRVGAFD